VLIPQSWTADVARADVFAGLPSRDIAALARIARPRSVAAGTFLARQRERGSEIFTIVRGSVQLVTQSQAGEITVRIAGPGECLPLAVLMDPGVHVTSAIAMTDVDALVMERGELVDVLRRRPRAGQHVYRMAATVLARRYNETLSRMTAAVDQVMQRGSLAAGMADADLGKRTPSLAGQAQPEGPANWPD
jgi:CRP-like cAMP-binding protein